MSVTPAYTRGVCVCVFCRFLQIWDFHYCPRLTAVYGAILQTFINRFIAIQSIVSISNKHGYSSETNTKSEREKKVDLIFLPRNKWKKIKLEFSSGVDVEVAG